MGEYLAGTRRRAPGAASEPVPRVAEAGQGRGRHRRSGARHLRMAHVLGHGARSRSSTCWSSGGTDLQQRLPHRHAGRDGCEGGGDRATDRRDLDRDHPPEAAAVQHPRRGGRGLRHPPAQEAAGFRRARLVFVINRAAMGRRPTDGGPHRPRPGRPRRPRRDRGRSTPTTARSAPEGRFPDGVREIDFARIVDDLDPEDGRSTPWSCCCARSAPTRSSTSTRGCSTTRCGPTAGRWPRPSGCSCASSATSRPRWAPGTAGACATSTGPSTRWPA